jgi:hypothetical protein
MVLHSKANPATALRLVLMRLWLSPLLEPVLHRHPQRLQKLFKSTVYDITEISLIQALRTPEKEIRGLAQGSWQN